MLHLARKRLHNSELVTDSNFIDVGVTQHQLELLHTERPEAEAKLPRLDLRSGFQRSERGKSCPFPSPAQAGSPAQAQFSRAWTSGSP